MPARGAALTFVGASATRLLRSISIVHVVAARRKRDHAAIDAAEHARSSAWSKMIALRLSALSRL